MAISGVNPKCYILALFVRDDGTRFLLGEDPFEFKNTQLHFQQNTMANDVVEVQGNDGYLLAGQVRRPGTQAFDGYVCNGTNSKPEVEAKRREFLQFFRRSHFYKVIYVFPDGTAIQRKQGFLVDDPTVQELYQQYPEYHVALNFEDVNYYTYEEDDEGHEIYAKEAIIKLAGGGATGGLIWDNYGVVWENPWSDFVTVSGTDFQVNNQLPVTVPTNNERLYGDTYQQTYSGFQLLQKQGLATPTTDTVFWYSVTNQTITALEDGWARFASSSSSASKNFFFNRVGAFSWEVDTTYTVICEIKNAPSAGRLVLAQPQNASDPFASISVGGQADYVFDGTDHTIVFSGTTKASHVSMGLRPFLNTAFASGSSVDLRLTIVAGDHTSDYQNYIGENWEPYTGGIPAPNPDYPQTVQTVTGEQTLEVTGRNLLDSLHGYVDGYINASGGIGGGGGTNALFDYIAVSPSSNYTLSQQGENVGNAGIAYFDANKTFISREQTYGFSSKTYSTPEGCSYVRIWVYKGGGINQAIIENAQLQLEQGSTATDYEPYQGQSYPISLGAIELCKIGNYQDYIYKNGNDWYVHKATGKMTLDGTESWSNGGNWWGSGRANYGMYCYFTDLAKIGTETTYNHALLCNDFSEPETGLSLRSGVNEGIKQNGGTGQQYIALAVAQTRLADVTSQALTLSSLKNWLSTNKPIVYHTLGTATDTKILNTTLLEQLNALGSMKLYIGENNILVGSAEPNLPATLEFTYGTQYAELGAEWEEGGTKGATIVDVNAIDNTYPVWELNGPAINPTLSVLTTNTVLTYNGTITASQRLIIDMFNKTATLNGTSVIGNITGDWVYMAPGTNRVAYTAGNTDAPDSTILWQEVVG